MLIHSCYSKTHAIPKPNSKQRSRISTKEGKLHQLIFSEAISKRCFPADEAKDNYSLSLNSNSEIILGHWLVTQVGPICISFILNRVCI